MRKYINRITALNFKGGSFDHELAPCTIITGDNSTRKSAIGYGLSVALLGYSPKHGKSPAKTWGFAGAPGGATEMAVSINIRNSDGLGDQTIAHRWNLKKGSVKWTLSPEGTGMPMVPPALLDVREEFLNKSGPAQVKFIFDQIDLAAIGFTEERLTAKIKAEVKVEAPSETSERVLRDIIEAADDLGSQREDLGWTFQQWIDAVVVAVKKRRDDAQAVVDQMTGVVLGTSQLQAREGINGGGSVRADLEQARANLADLNKLIGDYEKASAEFQRIKQRREDIQRQILAMPEPTEAVDLDFLQRTFDSNSKKIQEYKSTTVEWATKHSTAIAEASRWTLEMARLDNECRKLREEEMKVLAHDRCPTCRSKGTAWKEALKEDVEARVKQNRADHTHHAEELARCEKNKTETQQAVTTARAADDAQEQLRHETTRIQQRITQAREAAAQRTNLQARLQDIPLPAQIAEPIGITQQRAEVAEKIRRLEQQERQQVAAQQDQLRAAQARVQLDEKKIEVEVAKQAIKALADLSVELMKAAFDGFMGKVNLFCDGILPCPMVYRDGEIGYFAGASFASLDYMSDSEQIIAQAGLSVALAQGSPIRLVLVDRLEAFDPCNRATVVERMLDLIQKDTIDQFIGVEVDGGIENLWERNAAQEIADGKMAVIRLAK